MGGVLGALIGSTAKGLPLAPTGLSATDVGTSRVYNNGAATISFTPGAGALATSFTVTSSPGGYVGTGSASPITVEGLQSSTAYTFTATATNAVGTSDASIASNSITAITIPQAPTIGTATDVGTSRAYNNGAATVTYTTGATGGSTITGYTVTSSPGGFTGTGASPVTVAGLQSGTAYTFTVKATNAAGTSAASGATTSITATTIPQAPTIGTATNTGTSATVAYTAGATGGKTVTYTATSSPGGFTGTGFSPITVSGLTKGTGYTFTVVASNANGTSAASAASNSVTPATTVPGAPTTGTATDVGTSRAFNNGAASVDYYAPADNGGLTITGYAVNAYTTGGTFVAQGTGTTSPITVAGLSSSTQYYFQAYAQNSLGYSGPGGSSNIITATTVPQAPTMGSATAGNGSATVAYTAASTGGKAVSTYTATSSPSGFTGTGASPITVNGLTNGTAYTFAVKATNANGISGSSAASNSVTPATTPSAPTIGTLSTVGGIANGSNPQFTISFTAPASNGGSGITGYQYSTNSGTNWAATSGTTSAQTLTAQSNGAAFVAGTAYSVILRAVNIAGAGASSLGSNSATGLTLPATITVTTVSRVIGIAYGSNPQFTISYAVPANGGTAITGYQYSTNSGTNWAATSGTVSPQTLTAQSNGAAFVAGTAYSVILRAVTAYGTAGNSPASESVKAATVPQAPTIGTATDVGDSRPFNNGRATITYTAGATGGDTISTFTVTSSPGGYVGTALGSASSVTVSGLQSNTAYTFTVTAFSIGGTSAASGATTSITATTVPQAPTMGSATAGNGSATVSYTANATGGKAVSAYSATASPGGFPGSGASPITVNGLTNGTPYTFAVKAINANGTSESSAASLPVTPTAPVSFMLNYLVVAGGGGGGNGGGGAGGYRTGSNMATVGGGTASVTVGAGGTGDLDSTNSATNGSNSAFSGLISTGGGGGSGTNNSGNNIGRNGGSGGGGGATGGTGISGQGFNGNGGGTYSATHGGGGGGASALGGSPRINNGGDGGDGATFAQTGLIYAGGGAGGGSTNLNGWGGGTGGSGGGGNGGGLNTAYDETVTATAGEFGKGGGGGGGFPNTNPKASGANGGTGTVIVWYSSAISAATSTTGSPSFVDNGTNKIYTFTGNGSLTI